MKHTHQSLTLMKHTPVTDIDETGPTDLWTLPDTTTTITTTINNNHATTTSTITKPLHITHTNQTLHSNTTTPTITKPLHITHTHQTLHSNIRPSSYATDEAGVKVRLNDTTDANKNSNDSNNNNNGCPRKTDGSGYGAFRLSSETQNGWLSDHLRPPPPPSPSAEEPSSPVTAASSMAPTDV